MVGQDIRQPAFMVPVVGVAAKLNTCSDSNKLISELELTRSEETRIESLEIVPAVGVIPQACKVRFEKPMEMIAWIR